MEGAEVKTVPLTPELIDSYMDYLRAKGRVQGTIESCQRKLKRLYGDLPEAGKAVGRDTLGLWRRKLARDSYSAAAINQFMIAVNGYLEYMGAREFQVTDKLEVSDEFQPELTRGEYLRLLSAARSLGRERTYLLVKVFGNSNLPVQELEHLTVEAAQKGALSVKEIRDWLNAAHRRRIATVTLLRSMGFPPRVEEDGAGADPFPLRVSQQLPAEITSVEQL